MEDPLLTIITPVYNGQRFIKSCLLSVINQNCPEVEHLIMDGGSTDKTMDIIKDYAGCYPHIRWFSKKDQGQSASMNNGISEAHGRMIGFLNCDDYYETAVLPRILRILKQLPDPSFLVGNCNVLNDDDQIIYINKPSRLSLTNILIRGEKNQFPYNPSSYFYHKSLHEKVGPYDEADHYNMDLDFLLRMAKIAPIKYVDETWGNYRFIRGTKTFQSKLDNQLGVNEIRVMDIYLNELPWLHRWWIKINRHFQYFFDKHSTYYYLGRIMDCFRDPKEVLVFILKKLNLVIRRSPLQGQKQTITQSTNELVQH